MALSGSMTIEGIKGSSAVKGREGSIEILGASHNINIPTDPQTGKPTGHRLHGSMVISKEQDKASPSLYECLCEGKLIKQVSISWWENNEAGSEEIYFETSLKNCQISSIKTCLPNIKEPGSEGKVHQEEVSIRYEEITWLAKDGNQSYTDSWTDR